MGEWSLLFSLPVEVDTDPDFTFLRYWVEILPNTYDI